MPWSVELADPFTLLDGTRLVTFKDAIEALISTASPTAADHQLILDHAIELLVKACHSRKSDDILEATAMLALVFHGRRLLA